MRRLKILLLATVITLLLVKCDAQVNDTDRFHQLFGVPTGGPLVDNCTKKGIPIISDRTIPRNNTGTYNSAIGPNKTLEFNWSSLDNETKLLLRELFGNADELANSTTTETVPVNKIGNTTEKLNLLTPPKVESDCETKSSGPGVCVPYYLCDPADGTVIADGSGVLDIRFTEKECPHYLDVCCLTQNVTNKPARPAPPNTCGWSNPGGHELRFRDEDVNDNLTTAYYAEYPWVVALLKRSEPPGVWTVGDYIGVGSIIHPSVVLTAAHKVAGKTPNELKCRAGEWDTQTDYEEDPYQERDIRKIVIHKDFYRLSVLNSIALLFMEKPFEMASNVAVACIAPQPFLPQTYCQTTGWGSEFSNKAKYAVILKKIVLPTMGRDKCQRALRNTRLGSRFELHESLICAGGQKGQDVCTGDGGAPLMCPIGNEKEKTRFAIYGMVAYGIGCGKEGVPGVYVNVPLFHSWIQETMSMEGYGMETFTY